MGISITCQTSHPSSDFIFSFPICAASKHQRKNKMRKHKSDYKTTKIYKCTNTFQKYNTKSRKTNLDYPNTQNNTKSNTNMQNQTNSKPNTLVYKPKSKIKPELKPIRPKYSSQKGF